MDSKNFILIGAAGYVAPRHMEAIKSVNGNLVAALDPHDSVGILDRYFPECRMFTEFERLDRYAHKLLASNQKIDYVAICSPNYLHDAHCRWAMRIGADAICEKPLVLNERNLDGLKWCEEQTGRKVYVVLQLRLHPSVSGITYLDGQSSTVSVEYVTPRGCWYESSWKSDVSKSGGLATNIGVHLFDLASSIFGKMQSLSLMTATPTETVGLVRLYRAAMAFRLSIDREEKPARIFKIDGMEYDFTTGFSELHNRVYQDILSGNGFGIEDTREAIRICEAIRNYKRG